MSFHEETGESRQRRIFLVCGKTDYSHGLENLYAIIRFLACRRVTKEPWLFKGKSKEKILFHEIFSSDAARP